MPLVILDQAAAKAADELSELGYLEPRLSTELFPMIDGQNNLGLYAVRPEPGDDIQVAAEAIGL